eukprot:COSAG01_NODE_1884_length_8988_cov_8.068624_7_plen_1925_part_00
MAGAHYQPMQACALLVAVLAASTVRTASASGAQALPTCTTSEHACQAKILEQLCPLGKRNFYDPGSKKWIDNVVVEEQIGSGTAYKMKCTNCQTGPQKRWPRSKIMGTPYPKTKCSRTFGVPCGITYYIFFGKGCAQATGGCGLIVDVHGMGMTGREQMQSSGVRAEAARRGNWIVVNPESSGTKELFERKKTCYTLTPYWEPRVHHPELVEFMRTLVKVAQLDEKQVHITGFSQGGFASWNIGGCLAPDLVCSSAPAGAPPSAGDKGGPLRTTLFGFMDGTNCLGGYTGASFGNSCWKFKGWADKGTGEWAKASDGYRNRRDRPKRSVLFSYGEYDSTCRSSLALTAGSEMYVDMARESARRYLGVTGANRGDYIWGGSRSYLSHQETYSYADTPNGRINFDTIYHYGYSKLKTGGHCMPRNPAKCNPMGRNSRGNRVFAEDQQCREDLCLTKGKKFDQSHISPKLLGKAGWLGTSSVCGFVADGAMGSALTPRQLRAAWAYNKAAKNGKLPQSKLTPPAMDWSTKVLDFFESNPCLEKNKYSKPFTGGSAYQFQGYAAAQHCLGMGDLLHDYEGATKWFDGKTREIRSAKDVDAAMNDCFHRCIGMRGGMCKYFLFGRGLYSRENSKPYVGSPRRWLRGKSRKCSAGNAGYFAPYMPKGWKTAKKWDVSKGMIEGCWDAKYYDYQCRVETRASILNRCDKITKDPFLCPPGTPTRDSRTSMCDTKKGHTFDIFKVTERKTNLCHCSFGTPKRGRACKFHGHELCERCDDGSKPEPWGEIDGQPNAYSKCQSDQPVFHDARPMYSTSLGFTAHAAGYKCKQTSVRLDNFFVSGSTSIAKTDQAIKKCHAKCIEKIGDQCKYFSFGRGTWSRDNTQAQGNGAGRFSRKAKTCKGRRIVTKAKCANVFAGYSKKCLKTRKYPCGKTKKCLKKRTYTCGKTKKCKKYRSIPNYRRLRRRRRTSYTKTCTEYENKKCTTCTQYENKYCHQCTEYQKLWTKKCTPNIWAKAQCINPTPYIRSCYGYFDTKCSPVPARPFYGEDIYQSRPKPNMCHCPFGTPGKTGTSQCPSNGFQYCQRCNRGYYLKTAGRQRWCKARKCTCKHGLPQSGEGPECLKPLCRECKAGFRLVRSGSGYRCDPVPPCRAGSQWSQGSCKACPTGQYKPAGTGTCMPWQPCKAGTYLRAYSSAGAGVCTVCPAGTFKSIFGTFNTACIKWTTCTNGEYQTTAGTAFKDRVCATHGPACNSNEYQVRAPTKTTDRLCSGAGTCVNGKLIAQSSRQQANHCGSCNVGYTLISRKCVRNMCKCVNGAPKAGSACTRNGASMCQSCRAGYTINGARTSCVRNTCKCANGTPKIGSACSRNGAAMCQSCQAGYTINAARSSCVRNKCTCANGAAKTGSTCSRNGAAMCQSCQAGYTMNAARSSCVRNTCTCPDGAPKTGSACSRNGATMCQSCKTGYLLNNAQTRCIANQCTCTNGSPATGASCAKNGVQLCQTCKVGFILTSKATLVCTPVAPCIPGTYRAGITATSPGTCTTCPAGTFKSIFGTFNTACVKWTTCTNGEYQTTAGTAFKDRVCATHGPACNSNEYQVRAPTKTTDRLCSGAGTCVNGKLIAQSSRQQANHCGSCNVGYTLISRKCVRNMCKCVNGAPKAGSACTRNGASMCQSCRAGYTINGARTSCVRNTCKCANGTPKIGSACSRNGASMCQTCAKGFTLTGNSDCTSLNKCTCANGTPKTGSACSRNGAAMCQTCTKGYTMNAARSSCVRNSCKCANGIPVSGPKCSSNGASLCDTCIKGFTQSAARTACIRNICTCVNGTPKTGLACTRYGASMCQSCRAGYSLNKARSVCAPNSNPSAPCPGRKGKWPNYKTSNNQWCANLDSKPSVDVEDLLIVLATFGTSNCVGNIDDKPTVDVEDLLLVLAQFGGSC